MSGGVDTELCSVFEKMEATFRGIVKVRCRERELQVSAQLGADGEERWGKKREGEGGGVHLTILERNSQFLNAQERC